MVVEEDAESYARESQRPQFGALDIPRVEVRWIAVEVDEDENGGDGVEQDGEEPLLS